MLFPCCPPCLHLPLLPPYIIGKTDELLLLLLSRFSCVDPIDGSPLGSPIPGILQARVLEWGAIAFSTDELVPGNFEKVP